MTARYHETDDDVYIYAQDEDIVQYHWSEETQSITIKAINSLPQGDGELDPELLAEFLDDLSRINRPKRPRITN